MIILSSLLSILVPQLIAFGILSSLWAGQRPIRAHFLLKICFAVGLGFGILSCLFFLQLLFFGASRQVLASTLITVLIIVAAISFYRLKSKRNAPLREAVGEPLPGSRLRLVLSILFFAALASTTAAFIFISLKRPHGEWDAWAVYNMKARFLFRAGDNWRDLFSQPMEWASLDYPLLIPTAVAACWVLIGTETLVIPALVAMLFTLAIVGIAAYSVSALRGKTQGYLTGLVLLSTPYFITHGADQYSDIPIGFFFVATFALIALQDLVGKDDRHLLLLAGFTAGLSAWTKNEGLLFVIAILASRFAVRFPRNGLKVYLSEMRFFAPGLISILSLILYFKLTISAHSYLLLPPEGPNLIAKLTDFSRYLMTLDFLVRLGLAFGSWGVSIVPLLAFYLLLLGIGIEEKQKANVAGSLIALGVMLAGYFMIYVISPRDLEWHLSTSVDRLYSQLWPSFVFVFFLIVRTPEQALLRGRVDSQPGAV